MDPLDANAILTAANVASDRARAAWFIMLSVGTYLMVAVASTTHYDLLLDRPIKLPLLDVELSLASFFLVAPSLFVILHLYFLVTLYLLGRKLSIFKGLLRRGGKYIQSDLDIFNARLDTFIVLQEMIDSKGGIISRLLIGITVWITVIVAPVLLLLSFQIKFIPYHSEIATWYHRTLVLLDLILVWLLWPATLHSSGRTIPALISPFTTMWKSFNQFSTRVFNTFDAITSAGRINMPVLNEIWRGQLRLQDVMTRAQSILLMIFGSILLASFSLFVATIPDSSIERWMRDSGWFKAEDGTRPGELRIPLLGDPRLFDRWFTRNLVVRGDTRDKVTIPNVVLKQRNLIAAVFEDVNLSGADFTDAQLQNSVFVNANLDSSKMSCSDLISKVDCTNLEGVRFDNSSLNGAKLNSARLKNSSYYYVQANGADFGNADLSHTVFVGTYLAGASFYQADLNGADFGISGSYYEDMTDLRGAEFVLAKVQGANFSGADLTGADLRGAEIDDLQVPEERFLALIDTEAVDTSALDKVEKADWADFQKTHPKPNPSVVSEMLAKLACETDSKGWAASGIIARAARRGATIFNGDLAAISQLMMASSCPGVTSVPLDLRLTLCRSAQLDNEVPAQLSCMLLDTK